MRFAREGEEGLCRFVTDRLRDLPSNSHALIFQVRGESDGAGTPPAKSKHLASLALRQVQDFASSPSRGEGKEVRFLPLWEEEKSLG